MKNRLLKILIAFFPFLIIGITACSLINNKTVDKKTEIIKIDDKNFITYIVDVKTQNLKLYWKDEKDSIIMCFEKLKKYLDTKNQTLLFAMNAGMYKKDYSPKGLFIHEHKINNPLDTASGDGNFYLKPNGVFYITTDNIPVVCCTADFVFNEKMDYATQSGPMLLIDGNIHPSFKEGSKNLNIRNGVGVLPDNKVIFVMSKNEINFWDFANYFKNLGCKNALYLDGFVSRVYYPEQNWIQNDGKFGVMIGISKQK